MPSCADKASVTGTGVGYRPAFHDAFFSSSKPRLSWVEVITDNFFPSGEGETRARQSLRRLRADFPVALHGVGLSLASADPLSERYLSQLSRLVGEIEPWLVTDHLCWTGVGGESLFDLLPFPYTSAALGHVAARVQRVQDLLRRPLGIENISFYAPPSGCEMDEADFLRELCARAGCRLLLDINNIYVNAANFGFSAAEALARVDLRHVAEIHLAGPTRASSGLLIDTHGAPVTEEVWGLYESVLARDPSIPAMIERDQDIPAWEVMEEELGRLRDLQARYARGGSRERAYEHDAGRVAGPLP